MGCLKQQCGQSQLEQVAHLRKTEVAVGNDKEELGELHLGDVPGHKWVITSPDHAHATPQTDPRHRLCPWNKISLSFHMMVTAGVMPQRLLAPEPPHKGVSNGS